MTIHQNARSQRESEERRLDQRYARSSSRSGIVDPLTAEPSPLLTVQSKASGAQGPAVLLTSSRYLGTLAAVRSFGREGIPSVVADDRRLGPASWSRFVGRRVKCPADSRPQQLIEWLLAFGKANPDHVLCATSDESAWLYSKYRTELSQHFHMYQPSVEAVYSLLNKRRLYDIGRAEAIDFPRTWFPQSQDDLRAVVQEAQFPVLTKPVTQILHTTHTKGAVCDDASALSRLFSLMSAGMYQPELLAFDPSVVCPMVQEFQPTATEGIYSLSGFIDESGKLLAARGAMKILQRPRRLGVGLCFERADVKPHLVDALGRICRRAGYYGVFEAEFIHRDGKDLLIDFNPRFYGQMGFDIARGLPVPLLAYYAALGDWQTVKALAERAVADDGTVVVHCNRIDFEIMLRAQRLSGGMTGEEVRFWRRWYRRHEGRAVHGIMDKDDWRPFMAEIARVFLEHLRHPRATLKSSMMKAVVVGLDLQLKHL
jgi:D-aspartate ligase